MEIYIDMPGLVMGLLHDWHVLHFTVPAEDEEVVLVKSVQLLVFKLHQLP